MMIDANDVPDPVMNELQFANKVRQALNEGARLDAVTRERLRAARERALDARQRERSAAPALADNTNGRLGGLWDVSVSFIVPLLLLVVGLASLYSGQQKLRAAEAVDLETQLITDELPIDAYLDKGFEAWLKQQRER